MESLHLTAYDNTVAWLRRALLEIAVQTGLASTRTIAGTMAARLREKGDQLLQVGCDIGVYGCQAAGLQEATPLPRRGSY